MIRILEVCDSTLGLTAASKDTDFVQEIPYVIFCT